MDPITRRTAFRFLGAGAAGAAVAGSSGLLLPALADTATGAADRTASRIRRRFPGDPGRGNLRYGAAVQGGNPRTFEHQLGHKLQSFRQYFQGSDSPAAIVAGVKRYAGHHRVPIASLKVPNNDIAGFIRGRHDRWMLDTVHGLARLDLPVWLVLQHEPSDNMAPAQYRAMMEKYRRLRDHAARGSKVLCVGILNGWSFQARGATPRKWNPGTDVLHLLGYDSYNQYPRHSGAAAAWTSPSDRLRPGVTIMSWGYKTTLVGEYGVRRHNGDPGKAAAWLREYYRLARQKGFCSVNYFWSGENSPDGTWRFSAGDERNAAFKNCLANSIRRQH